MFLPACDPGILVHFEPKAMSGAVHKISVQAVVRQNSPGGGVDITAACAGLRCRYGSGLRFLHGAVPSADALWGAPDKHSPRDIAAIMAEYSTQVQHHQFIFPQSFSGRSRMRIGRALAEGYDRLERRTGGASPAHLVFNFRAHIDFGDTRFQELQCAAKNFACEVRGLAHLRDLAVILTLPQRLRLAIRFDPSRTRTGGFAEGTKLRDGQLPGVESDPPSNPAAQQPPHGGHQRWPLLDDANSGGFLLRLLCKAPVGHQRAAG